MVRVLGLDASAACAIVSVLGFDASAACIVAFGGRRTCAVTVFKTLPGCLFVWAYRVLLDDVNEVRYTPPRLFKKTSTVGSAR